jgi:hypothetical protein
VSLVRHLVRASDLLTPRFRRSHSVLITGHPCQWVFDLTDATPCQLGPLALTHVASAFITSRHPVSTDRTPFLAGVLPRVDVHHIGTPRLTGTSSVLGLSDAISRQLNSSLACSLCVGTHHHVSQVSDETDATARQCQLIDISRALTCFAFRIARSARFAVCGCHHAHIKAASTGFQPYANVPCVTDSLIRQWCLLLLCG